MEKTPGKSVSNIVRIDRHIFFLNLDIFFITGVLDFTFDIMSSVNDIQHADHSENHHDEEITSERPKVRQIYLNLNLTH